MDGVQFNQCSVTVPIGGRLAGGKPLGRYAGVRHFSFGAAVCHAVLLACDEQQRLALWSLAEFASWNRTGAHLQEVTGGVGVPRLPAGQFADLRGCRSGRRSWTGYGIDAELSGGDSAMRVQWCWSCWRADPHRRVRGRGPARNGHQRAQRRTRSAVQKAGDFAAPGRGGVGGVRVDRGVNAAATGRAWPVGRRPFGSEDLARTRRKAAERGSALLVSGERQPSTAGLCGVSGQRQPSMVRLYRVSGWTVVAEPCSATATGTQPAGSNGRLQASRRSIRRRYNAATLRGRRPICSRPPCGCWR